jgi:hypothetical protein
MGNRSDGWSRYLVGWGLVLLGVAFLLEKLGLIRGTLWSYWPVLLIIIGIGVLTRKR